MIAPAKKPRVLLVHALLWPNVGRLCSAFQRAGFEVGALAQASHPVHRMRSPSRAYVYRPTAPGVSVNAAIQSFRPDLIIPCDDRAVSHLCSLYRGVVPRSPVRGDVDVRKLIETSLGLQVARGRISKRSLLAELSHLPDVHVPQIDDVASLADLRAWAARNGLPAVLKLDGSWGGQDVILVRTEVQLARAYFEMRLRRSSLMNLKRTLFNGDIEPLVTGSTGAQITVQSFVAGRLANIALATWRGEVLATVAVEVVSTAKTFGRATVVRQVEGQEMIETGRAIARRLELSGLHGLDFVLDEASNQANLLEINPRATQTHHLIAGEGFGLPAAMHAALAGASAEAKYAPPMLGEIALFPDGWLQNRGNSLLSTILQDIPHEEPELAKYYGYSAP